MNLIDDAKVGGQPAANKPQPIPDGFGCITHHPRSITGRDREHILLKNA